MKTIPRYDFHKTKYGDELLIDVVPLSYIKKYIDIHPVHTLTYFDITFIEHGPGSISIDNNRYEISSGDIVFSMPGDIRAWNDKQLPEGHALIFEEEFLISFFNDPQFVRNLAFFSHRKTSSRINICNIEDKIKNLLQDILAEINNYTSKDEHILRALLYEILMLLNREYQKQNNESSAVNAKSPNRYAESFTNLVNEDFTRYHHIQYYADRLCITPNYLNEVVKKATGINPKRYIRNKIFAEAKKLLTYTSFSISEISEKLGYEDTSYFIRSFRKETNSTPLQYRNQTKR